MNRLKGLTLEQSDILIDALEQAKDDILDITIDYKNHPNWERIEYLLSQLYTIKNHLKEQV